MHCDVILSYLNFLGFFYRGKIEARRAEGSNTVMRNLGVQGVWELKIRSTSSALRASHHNNETF